MLTLLRELKLAKLSATTKENTFFFFFFNALRANLNVNAATDGVDNTVNTGVDNTVNTFFYILA